jgi:hypothetical protein
VTGLVEQDEVRQLGIARPRKLVRRPRKLVPLLQGRVEVPIGLVRYAGLPSSGLFAASTASDAKPSLSLYRVLHRHTDTTLVEVCAPFLCVVSPV